MQVQTSWKLIMGCLMVLGGLSMPVAGEEEPQLVFRAPSQQEKKVEHKQVPDAPQTLKDALGYDFDDEAFVRNYQCDPDKGYRIHMRNREPFLMTIDDFLTPGECDHLIAVGLPLLKRSLIVAMGGEEEGRAQSEWRTSSTAFMPRSNDKVFQCIEQRISKLASLPAENIEPLQLVRYFPGQQYREHYDWFHNDDAGKIELSYGGQRVISMFAYLNTLEEGQGGETRFPHMNLSVPAVKGRATFWFNVGVDGVEHEHALHAGLPITHGLKFGLNIPIRERKFVSIR